MASGASASTSSARRTPTPARRATCSTWCRLLAAAAGSRSGHSSAITCSRLSRFPGASASSLTTVRALRRRQALSGTGVPSAVTPKPPSSSTRTAGPVWLGPPRLHGRAYPRSVRDGDDVVLHVGLVELVAERHVVVGSA